MYGVKVMMYAARTSLRIQTNRFNVLSRRFSSITNSEVQDKHPAEEPRAYFYYIDSRGWVFFEEEEYRNFATALKDKKFLVV